MTETYIDTYYRRTIADHPAHATLADSQQVDVCVIGGGLAGISTATECGRRGLKVAVLEQHRIAWGASGRNGGFVTAGYATGHAQIARRAGEADARRCTTSRSRACAWCGRTLTASICRGVNPTPGILRAIRYDDAAGLQAEAAEAKRKFGATLHYLPAPKCRKS